MDSIFRRKIAGLAFFGANKAAKAPTTIGGLGLYIYIHISLGGNDFNHIYDVWRDDI
jgi:hypothetical protein